MVAPGSASWLVPACPLPPLLFLCLSPRISPPLPGLSLPPSLVSLCVSLCLPSVLAGLPPGTCRPVLTFDVVATQHSG